jgi:serine/threonine protein kinase
MSEVGADYTRKDSNMVASSEVVAPELLSSSPVYSQQSDIWQVGCILYELVTRTSPFLTDLDVSSFANWPEQRQPVLKRYQLDSHLNLLPEKSRIEAKRTILQTLEVEPWKRPIATYLVKVFQELILVGANFPYEDHDANANIGARFNKS